MIMNMNEKGRQTKLLAAIAILAMVVCVFAAVMPSDTTGAVTVPEDPDFTGATNLGISLDEDGTIVLTSDGNDVTDQYVEGNVITLKADTIFTLTTDITLSDYRIDLAGYDLKITGGHTFDITNDIDKTGEGYVFSGKGASSTEYGSIVIDGTTVNMTAEVANAVVEGTSKPTEYNHDIHILLNVKGLYVHGSTVTMTQAGNVMGSAWWNESAAAPAVLVMDNDSVLNDKASGFTAQMTLVNSKVVVDTQQYSSIGLADGSKLENSSVTMVNTAEQYYRFNEGSKEDSTDDDTIVLAGKGSYIPNMYLYGNIALTGASSLTVNKTDINMGCSITMDAGSYISAVHFDVYSKTTADVSITGGTVYGQITKQTSNVNYGYDLENVTIGPNADDSVGNGIDGASVTVTGTLTIPAGMDFVVAGTLTNNGTIDMGADSLLTKGESGNITNTAGKITYAGSTASVVDTITDETFKDVSVVIFNGTINDDGNGVTVPANKTLIITSSATVNKPITLGGEGANVQVTASNKDFTINNSTGTEGTTNANNGSAVFSGFTGTVTATYGSVKIEMEEGAGSIKVEGNVLIEGTVTGAVTITSDSKESISTNGNIVIRDGGSLTIDTDVELTVSSGDSIINEGTLTVDGKIVNNGNIYSSAGAKIVGAEKITGNAVVGGLGIGTNMDAVTNLDLSGYTFLTSDFTIPYGKTVTINNGGTLDLRGYTLTVLGTLVISNSGVVVDYVGGGSIAIGSTGVIDNTGVIGSADAPVTVSLASGVPGSVTLANVNGLSFGYKRVVAEDSVSYYLTIAGDASKRGTGEGYITIAGEVYASDALSIGSKVNMTVNGTLYLDNGVELTVTASGTASGTGSVVLGVGSIVDVDGRADIKVSAMTGDYQASNGAPGTESYVDIDNVKGIEVTVTSASYSDKGVLKYAQRLDVSGALDDADADNGITFSGAYITVTGTLTVGKDINTWKYESGAKITVTGTVSWIEGDTNIGTSILKDGNIDGTHYTVQTTVEGVTPTTNYVTSFQAAVENIANVYDMPTVYGDVEVDFDFELGAEQTITGAGTMTIDEGATVTVANDANMEFNTIKVDGKLVVYVNGNVAGTIDYDVRSVNDEFTTTYSGFAVALSEAQPGSTITVEGAITVDEDVTIPEGVTVVITNTSSLTIGTTDSNTSCDLTVNGTLNVMGTVEVDGDVSVSGAMDVTEAQEFTASEITVTGTVTSFGDAIDETKINAVKYEALDGNTVYTNLASAAEVVNAYDVNKYIYLLGTVSDSAAVTLDGTTLYVNGTARLGTITLDEASIVIANNEDYAFTGTVAGLSGTEGATVDTAVAFTAVKNAVIANTVIPNESNVNEYTVYVAQYVASDSSATENATVNGAVSVDAGVLEVRTMTFTGDKNTLTVGANATAVIAGGNTLTAATANNVNGVTVDGTMTVNGTLKVTGTMDVTGTLDVAKAERGDAAKVEISFTAASGTSGDYAAHPEYWAVLNIMGTMNISDAENREGTVVINGILAVGSAPTTLGVGGTVTGPIATGSIGDNGYIKAYAGADLSGAQILIDTATGESQADSTVFYINGTEYMTVYVDGTEVSFDEVLANEEFDLVGYETKVSDSDGNVTYDIQRATDWNSDADLNQGLADSTVVGSIDAAYTKVSASEVRVTVSVGEGISLYIDDIRMTGNYVMLSVGTHNVYAVVNPGFAGDVTISFNGSAVEGTFTVTPEMSSAAYEGTPAISATGNITADTPEIVVPGTSSGDDGMGLTDYLLIILVILIVIMAIMVAFRLMRS